MPSDGGTVGLKRKDRLETTSADERGIQVELTMLEKRKQTISNGRRGKRDSRKDRNVGGG